MTIHRWRSLVATAPLLWLLSLASPAGAEFSRAVVQVPDVDAKDRHGVFVLDGSFIHDAGELQLNVTNWGLLGSQPSSLAPYSDSPSAMWPAGSGVDHLFAAGLWIGGIRNGVPLVSTGQFENELMPTADPFDTIYESKESDEEGGRYPLDDPDDDGDGQIDEDPLNGLDDDGDGEIDEDYAAISNQYFRFAMRDDVALARELYPDHEPLGVEVIQESMQWENLRLEDAIGFDVSVRNITDDAIDLPAFGVFADGDIGRRSGVSVSQDDMVGFWEGSIGVADGTTVPVSIAYMYDCDGDDGDAPGYIGFLFLGVRTVPDRRPAPDVIGIESLRVFAGLAPFDRGGDPNSDAERYDTMTGGIDPRFPSECIDANDYRFVMSFQPRIGQLRPGQTIRFQWAMVAGSDLTDLLQNAGEINQAYLGQWYDRDGSILSGWRGREKYVCLSDFGEPGPGNPLFNLQRDCGFCLNPHPQFGCPTIAQEDLDKSLCLWLNDDCDYEGIRGALGLCWQETRSTDLNLAGCTGVGGREHHVYWIAESPLPPPGIRVWERDNSVHVFWDDAPEDRVDLDFGLPNFESYRIWRADDWSRPAGTSIETGPGTEQWSLISEFDQVSRYLEITPPTSPGQPPRTQWLPLGQNTGLSGARYTPLALRPGTPEQEELSPLRELVDRILLENPSLPSRNPIRYLGRDGQPSDLGLAYPELADWQCCDADIDTLAWVGRGRSYYEYIDREVANGFYYFYSVTASTALWDDPLVPNDPVIVGPGPAGQPQRSFVFAVPQSPAQSADARRELGQDIYVVPNPVTRQALADFQPLQPNSSDPTGFRLEFRNLPAARNNVSVYTLAGDLVVSLSHDGRGGSGSLPWNLVSRKGQEIVSGVYLFSVESDDPSFDDVVGRFVVVR